MLAAEAEKKNSKLILGTAQIGMRYGVANRSGQPDEALAVAIVKAALDGGITTFDTAQAYGDSEHVLGQALVTLGALGRVKVFTKIDPGVNYSDLQSVNDAVYGSGEILGSSFFCCMLHNEIALNSWSDGLGATLLACRNQGLFKHIGVSVYDPPAAIRALQIEGIDYIQIPGSVLDRRHEKNGVVKLADKLNKDLVVRSVYLQGALLMPAEELPAKLQHLTPYVKSFCKVASNHKLTTKELALGFAKKQWPRCMITIGAELPNQVAETVQIWDRLLGDEPYTDIQNLADDIPLEVVRPDLW